MQLLDGKACAAEIKREVATETARLARARKPVLALVRVGEDPASKVYVASKAKASEECGIESRNVHLPEDSSEARVLGVLSEFNEDRDVDGILLQLPLPRQVDADRAIASISPEKDVDGFHPESLGRLAAGAPRFVPCTPLGIRELLIRNQIATAGANVVVLGRSVIVGKPMALLLSLKGEGGDATVTMCHSRSRDVAAHTRRADIVIAAMGVPRFLQGDMIKDGAVVVDVGINRVDDPSSPKGYHLVGDVDFDAVAPRTSFITPVPGGVGPMTVAMLMANTLSAFRMRTGS
ncbi:MAG TPA: bifunctional methylenetetrahydrofolate dehydrogenase/methenyltetrahydrofolate cyclohydrolase FolD [Candidatus Krumholzibacteria bacterium]|nr:bifunctional methylenetetrahydrofolate dehydrogenase/methenyltetrahydrofolate cyclohydrolase FolD [Candidatus Krumholzibacteria bacterium]